MAFLLHSPAPALGLCVHLLSSPHRTRFSSASRGIAEALGSFLVTCLVTANFLRLSRSVHVTFALPAGSSRQYVFSCRPQRTSTKPLRSSSWSYCNRSLFLSASLFSMLFAELCVSPLHATVRTFFLPSRAFAACVLLLTQRFFLLLIIASRALRAFTCFYDNSIFLSLHLFYLRELLRKSFCV